MNFHNLLTLLLLRELLHEWLVGCTYENSNAQVSSTKVSKYYNIGWN